MDTLLQNESDCFSEFLEGKSFINLLMVQEKKQPHTHKPNVDNVEHFFYKKTSTLKKKLCSTQSCLCIEEVPFYRPFDDRHHF